MVGTHTMLSTFYSATTVQKLFSNGKEVVVLMDTLTGNGRSYLMRGVVGVDKLGVKVYKLPYTRAQRCQLFQKSNYHEISLPFEINISNIKNNVAVNKNYELEI